MKRLEWHQKIEKSEFIYKTEFMVMEHNYLCACCKIDSAVQDMNTGLLQPCWQCQELYLLQPVSWFTKWKLKRMKVKRTPFCIYKQNRMVGCPR